MLYLPAFCSSHVTGELSTVLQQACVVHCDLRLHPIYFDLCPVVCLCKSVGGSLQVQRIRRSSLKSQQKSAQDDDYRWTTVLRCFGKVPMTNLVLKLVSNGVLEWKSQGK